MSNHYYSAKPESKQKYRTITAELLGNHLSFRTNAGVFSKKGIDFGSRLLIETVVVNEGDQILDLGCGYGPVGIALAKANPLVLIQMVDINERAVSLADENAKINHVEKQVKIKISDGFDNLSDSKFNSILCNPPIRVGKSFIYGLFSDARNYLLASGSLWVVIRKQQGAVSAKQELASLFDDVEVVTQKKGYCIIHAKNN